MWQLVFPGAPARLRCRRHPRQVGKTTLARQLAAERRGPVTFFDLERPGLLHSLLRIVSADDLERHPKIGASWEGFAIRCIERTLRVRPGETHFGATHAGAELDLLVARGRCRIGFEVKRTTAPTITKSMHVAMADLKLERLDVIHAKRSPWPRKSERSR